MKQSAISTPPSSFIRRDCLTRLAACLVVVFSLSFDCARAQTPAGGQDSRGIGVRKDEQKTQTQGQANAAGAKPELVLQTGYTFAGPTEITFSPDGRLLATAAFGSSQIKLWEVATGRELRTLVGSSGAGFAGVLSGVSSVAFSRDSRLFAAGGQDNSVKVWDVVTGRELRTISGAPSEVGQFGAAALAFSPDGRTVISIAANGMKFWDVATGRQTRSLDLLVVSGGLLFGGKVPTTPDGGQLVLVTFDLNRKPEVKFIDAAVGRETRRAELPGDLKQFDTSVLALTPDGRVLGAVIERSEGGAGQLKLWDITAKGKGRALADVPAGLVARALFSPDGRVLALYAGSTVRLWDTATGNALPTVNVPNSLSKIYPDFGVNAAAFSPDGKLLATSGFDTRINLWEASTARPVRSMEGRANMAYEVFFSADGSRLFSGAKTVWDLKTGQGLRASSAAQEFPFGGVSRDGRLLALFNRRDNRVALYDVAAQKQTQTLAPPEQAAAQQAAFSPDGKLVATTYCPTQEQTRAQSVSSAKISPKEMMKAAEKAAKAARNNPADYLRVYNEALSGSSAAPSIFRQVKIWDAGSGRELRTISLPSGGIFGAAICGVWHVGFSPDGRQLVITNFTGDSTTLWDVATGQQLRSFGATAAGGQFGVPSFNHAGLNGVTAFAFSSDGRLLVTGGREAKIGFDPTALISAAMAGGSKPSKGIDPQDFVEDLLDAAKTSGPVRIWDVATGREVRALPGHATMIRAVAFSPDTRLLASSASDNTVKLWDAGSGRELRALTGQSAGINSLAFSPDGKLLAGASDDGGTYLWDARTGEHLLTLVSLFNGGEWLVITPDGLFDGTPASWNQILWRYDEDTFNVAPVEWFFNEFYSPGLLSDIFAGKRPKAAQSFSLKERRQPQLKLMLEGAQASPNATVNTRTVKVKIEVTEAPPDAQGSQASGARDLRLFRNGSLVKVWRGDVLRGQAATTLEAEIPVVAGENRLTAYAFNRDNVKSKDATLTVGGDAGLRRAGVAYVLAVGVNEYANPQYNLKFAVADAQEFAAEVSRQQARLGHFERTEVVPLFDKDATKANILEALRRLSGAKGMPSLKAGVSQSLERLKPAEPEDAVIIYFAGHGTAQRDRFYLIPHDLGYKGDRNDLDEAGLRSLLANSISDEELESAVEGLDAGRLLMVIDACNSGQALEAEEKRRGPMNSKGLAQLAYEKGMYILTAAQSYQAALEAAQLGHGLLTYALVEEGLKALAADAEPKDGTLLAKEWLDFATERVPQMQVEKMRQARSLGVQIVFAEGDQVEADPERRGVQRPRAFYRRELEANPFVLAAGGKQ